MELEKNLHYWEESLKKPEPIVDEFYVVDNVIVNNEEFIQMIEKLRKLIADYCREKSEEILNQICELILSVEEIEYTEFVAFWKVLDISFSVFRKFQEDKKIEVLKIILKEYCSKRLNLYEKLGYSSVTIQALYDSGVSRKKGSSGIDRIIHLLSEVFGTPFHAKSIQEILNNNICYFLPDMGDEKLFREFCNCFSIRYQFGQTHQNKLPDIVVKIDEHFLIIEAKHIKETGGAQDKQVNELIQFISYSEESKFIHYLAFLDGVYFNEFINPRGDKIKKQVEDIVNSLISNPNNFFVNTSGIKKIFKDLFNLYKTKYKNSE
jgi:Txe/YoeB family toxin of Txe-Axe toxin-antitoxin module